MDLSLVGRTVIFPIGTPKNGFGSKGSVDSGVRGWSTVNGLLATTGGMHCDQKYGLNSKQAHTGESTWG